MKKLLVIGIGAGDPDYLTLQAVKAIGRADVFLVLDKGEEKSDLVRLRQDMLARYARPGHRVVQAADPDRDRAAAPAAYAAAVSDWRARRADLYQAFVRDEVPADGTGALLVWGDPSLYDSTIAAVDEVLARAGSDTGSRQDTESRQDAASGQHFEYSVVPGISCVSALTAAHRIPLNRVGRPVTVTTGRRLAATAAADVPDDVAVMLDAHDAFAGLAEPEAFTIYWGAYVGTPDELLLSGPVAEIAPTIQRVRAEARARKGWIMDTYLLRRVDAAN
ncbi:precorrin-6A synthase (deacetylating) [Streptacidiphilus sp. N1-3]|uniref:Precorrin-6A synthase (Deacetylating) n=1 Tax=Streptacidiphilus alkalitolerans TaxID=3342712 RepID=A0ABV6WX39_9ACTN